MLLPKHDSESKNTLSKTCYFFFLLLNDCWNFTSCAKSFDLTRTVDMEFFLLFNIDNKHPVYFGDFLRHIQYVCLIPFVWHKHKCIWNEFIKRIKDTGVWTMPYSMTQYCDSSVCVRCITNTRTDDLALEGLKNRTPQREKREKVTKRRNQSIQRHRSEKGGGNLGQIVVYPVFHIMTAGFKQDVTCKVIKCRTLYTEGKEKILAVCAKNTFLFIIIIIQ